MNNTTRPSENEPQSFQQLYEASIDLLHRLTTADGILASTIEADNYKRVWARDSIVCGLAGLMIDDPVLIEGLKQSLLTLAKTQHELGMIPSNVLPTDLTDISFGSLVGRVDANTWFIVGCCSYYQKTKDEENWLLLKPAVQKCRAFLKASEFNDRGWIYTPLSGNWADEYPIHGYTLYDNMLRIWGESLWEQLTGESIPNFSKIKSATEANFWPSKDTPEEKIYHKDAFNALDLGAVDHFCAFILPGIYDNRFDAAGNALALYQITLDDAQKEKMNGFISRITSELNRAMIPAFWPMITADSPDWNLLKGNYSFSFKNDPGAFHNGGIWPVWMGLFCLGLSKNGLDESVQLLVADFVKTVNENADWDFQEFFNAKNLQVGGKTQMGYTASGIVFMKLALNKKFNF